MKRLVDLHDGTVRAASPGPGKGSTFTVTLPKTSSGDEAETQSSLPDVKASQRSEPLSSEPLSIVLVEDNDDIREAMHELLTELGHTVQTADNGRSGADLILRHCPDVAIVDLGLPVLDGYQVAEIVRAHVGPNGTRLVAMSGFGQEADRIRTRQAGFDAHLVKPADIESVVEILTSKAG